MTVLPPNGGFILSCVAVFCSMEHVVGTLEQVCVYNDYMTSGVGMDTLGQCGKSLTDLVVDKCGGIMYMTADVFPYSWTNIRGKTESHTTY